MLEIKNLLAFALLGTAVWFLERILENSITFTIWTVYTLSTFIFFIVRFIKLRREKASQIVSLVSIIALLFNYGIILMNSNYFPSFKTGVSDNSFAGNWVDKTSYKSLINHIEVNQKNHDAAIVKFYADWCIECKHVEKNILTDREVTEKLNQFILINIDVTEMTNEQNDLLKKYQLYGPPAFVILDSNEFTTIAPLALQVTELVKTILALPGKGLPIESHVFLPIISGLPIVIFFNLLRSPGKCQSKFFPSPIILFSFIATIQKIGFFNLFLVFI